MAKVKTLLVDDHNLFRVCLRKMLETEAWCEVVGEADSGERAIELAGTTAPDLILMDISLPDFTGLEATKIITKMHPGVNVVMLSSHTEDSYIEESKANGAVGYLYKHESETAFLSGIKNVMSDKIPEILDQEVEEKSLTTREVEIVQLIADGHTTNEIADKLFISPKTVNNHRTNILTKLKVRNSMELIRYAIKGHIITA